MHLNENPDTEPVVQKQVLIPNHTEVDLDQSTVAKQGSSPHFAAQECLLSTVLFIFTNVQSHMIFCIWSKRDLFILCLYRLTEKSFFRHEWIYL